MAANDCIVINSILYDIIFGGTIELSPKKNDADSYTTVFRLRKKKHDRNETARTDWEDDFKRCTSPRLVNDGVFRSTFNPLNEKINASPPPQMTTAAHPRPFSTGRPTRRIVPIIGKTRRRSRCVGPTTKTTFARLPVAFYNSTPQDARVINVYHGRTIINAAARTISP